MMSVDISGIVILSIKSGHYHCIISRINKNEAINLIQNADNTEACDTIFVIQKHVCSNKGCFLAY